MNMLEYLPIFVIELERISCGRGHYHLIDEITEKINFTPKIELILIH